MILLADPRVAACPVAENGEALVDLRGVPELRLAEQWTDERGGTFALLRGSVVRRLQAAQVMLPRGLQLLVVEGYRSPAQQRATFDAYREQLRQAHPSWLDERLYAETSKFASPIDVAPHVTGGAVDITICDADGEWDMGTEVDATPEASDNACFTAAENISPAARERRRVLSDVLTEVGLVNYPTEWWHWSYGDRYWALLTGAAAAIHGPLEASDDSTPQPREFSMEARHER